MLKSSRNWCPTTPRSPSLGREVKGEPYAVGFPFPFVVQCGQMDCYHRVWWLGARVTPVLFAFLGCYLATHGADPFYKPLTPG